MTNLQVEQQTKLKRFIERIEAVEDERKALADDVKDLLEQAKAAGFDTKTIKKVVAIRKKDKTGYLEEQDLLDAYLAAVSWLATPLGARSEPEQLVAAE